MPRNKSKKLKGKQGNKGKTIKPPPNPLVSTDNLIPFFSLQYIDREYCISKCDQQEKAAFTDKLHKMSQQTWRQLKLAPRHGSGYEKIDKDMLVRPIPAQIMGDSNIIAFRFHGMAPIVGYRDGQTFFVIWVDRDFTLYPH